MRAPAKLLLGALAIAAGVLPAGCDWREFDTLQNQTPVRAIDPPSGFPSSSDFASVLLPVTPPVDGSSAAWFLTSATEATGLALVKLDASGGSSGLTLTGSVLDDLAPNPITAMAEIPGTGTGTALLGAPTVSRLLIVELEAQTVSQFIPSSTLTASDPLLGVGVAVGNLTGGAAPDLVAASSSQVHVFVDRSTTDIAPGAADLASCPITLPSKLPNQDRANRALVVGNLLASGPAIAIGTPGAAAPGSVSFFTASTSAVTCAGVLAAPALTSPPATANAGFGQTLAIGDFDGDGVADLLVGAPPYNVYLYKGPIAPGAVPTATIPAPLGSAQFGWALAAMNVDGKPGDEALVGDPGATLDGQTGAGNVSIYTGPELATMANPAPVLAAHDASTGQAYGSAVGALPFCASVAPCVAPPQLPLVGAPAKAFVYFTLGLTDPRAM